MDFSEQVTPGAFDPSNWFVRWAGDEYTISIAASSGFPASSRVLLTKSFTVPNPGPDVVSYAPPPFDITAFVGGAPAQAFADYPLVL